jgi:hypothetical protein
MKTFSALRVLLIASLALLFAACETTKPEQAAAMPAVGSAVSASAVASAPEPAPAPTTAAAVKAAEPASPAVELPVRPRPEQLFAEGSEAYEKGDYKAAIRKLSAASEAAVPGSALQRDSYKFLAFSYCVSNQKPACRARFVSLLKIAPGFQLTRAEAGHPLWGPVFREVQLAQSTLTNGTKVTKNSKSVKKQ